MSAASRAAGVFALGAWIALASGCTCTGFGHSVDDEFGCTTNADCPAGRVCLPDPESGELFCVVSSGTDSGDPGSDGGDGGSDAEIDSSTDSGPGTDSGTDSGPACPLGDPCDDGDLCTMGETCDAAGLCGGGAPVDCSALDDTCVAGVCNAATGACMTAPINEGGACDDGFFCTVTDTCASGACGGSPRSCTDANECTSDACDEVADACTTSDLPDGTLCAASGGCLIGGTCTGGACFASIPAPPGTACDDADACTSADACDAVGICDGSPVTCNDLNDCTSNGCDPATGCVFTPVANASPCDDGLFCTVSDQCTSGACGGAARDCSASADQCNAGACSEAMDTCVPSPLPGGTPCEDGAFCITGETCTAGACLGGGPRDCSAVADQCNTASCDEGADACAPVPVAGGTPCDDGAFCTIGEACAVGSCGGGGARSCSDGNQCTSDVCDETGNVCTNPALPGGTSCDDGAFCTTGETCAAGACGSGMPRACGDPVFCTADSCNELTDACVNDPVPMNGMGCDDGLFCSDPDTCAAGTCSGPARSCDDAAFCTADSCDEMANVCVNDPAPLNGTTCDDGLFCTDPDVCGAGSCGGLTRSCADAFFCTADSCNETTNACVNDPVPMNGDVCDDGLFCTVGEICGAGTCGGGASNPCDDLNACTFDSCDEGGNSCVNDPAPLNGMSCSDGLFCTDPDTCTAGACGGPGRICADVLFCNGVETCSEALDICAAGTSPCTADAHSCTVTCAEPTDTCNVPDETLCGAMEICNPVEYSVTVTGCGPVPVTFTTACPPSGVPGAAVVCTLALTSTVGIDGEAARIACTATPMPATMFTDDFDDGALDPPWATVIGSPSTDSTPGTGAASAVSETWEADVVLSVAGLSVVCVDFDVAQENAGGFERIRWDVRFDAGLFSTVFDLDFAGWEAVNVTHAYNRNVCVAVPMGATTVTWRLRMSAGNERVWVDNVAMSGIAAAYTIPTNGGPDDMATEAGWTFAGGSSPYVGVNGGSNAMFANVETFTATRGVIDATSCDVLDVDFDFGFLGTTDTADDITLDVSVDGGAFTTVELLNLAAGAWNVNDTLLPWFGLRRVTATVPSAAGAASVVFRFTLRSDDGGDRVWVDNFVVRCADLPVPVVGSVADAGGGAYTVSVTSAVPEDVQLECVWATTNDGPLVSSDVVTIY